MSWVTVVWSSMAGVCVTLALIYLTVGVRKKWALEDLTLSAMALAAAGLAASELWIMRSGTVGQIATAVRWYQVPAWAAIVSLVLFIRFHLKAGRAWLAWSVCLLRTASLGLNFQATYNINFREITGLRRLSFLGESVSFPAGVLSPLMLVAQASLLLLLVFIADAAVSAWRRGDRRSALTAGVSSFVFVFGATLNSVLVLWAQWPIPLITSVFYMGVIWVTGYEVTREMLLAERMAGELQESEARYRNVFEKSLEGIYRTTMDGKLIFANPATAGILGYDSPEEFLRSVADVRRDIWADPEERARLIRMVEAGGAVRAHEVRFKRKDGTPIWISLSTRPHYGPGRRIDYFDGFLENIDERKKAQLSLIESERRYRALFESSPAGILLVGTDGHVQAANAMQARLYGFDSAEQLIGAYTPMFVAERDRERGAQNMRSVLEGNDLTERIYTAVRRDGSEFTVAVTSAPIRDDDKKMLGYLCLTRDITQIEKDECERIQLRLERNQLAQALTVDQISTSLAHEINQPLGAILNNAEAARNLLARAGSGREVLSEIVDDIIQDAVRAGDIVRKVRAVLKKGEVQPERLSVKRLIDETVEILSNNLLLHDVGLRLELGTDVADVAGDRVRLQQVLLNLMTNALDAMRETPAKVLTIASRMDGPQTVAVSVGDTGPGLPGTDREQIFRPFFTTKRGGLGLGLSICRSIVEEHGGRIWADSVPGRGATLSFSLKAWKEEGTETKVP